MNIKEIAQLAGVSTSTVSKIVNQKDESISQETRERVLKIVKEYNYTPTLQLHRIKKHGLLAYYCVPLFLSIRLWMELFRLLKKTDIRLLCVIVTRVQNKNSKISLLSVKTMSMELSGNLLKQKALIMLLALKQKIYPSLLLDL